MTLDAYIIDNPDMRLGQATMNWFVQYKPFFDTSDLPDIWEDRVPTPEVQRWLACV